MARDRWLRRIQELDPERDFEEIYRISCAHEFPWDTTQALGMALYRTYAVPGIGALLAQTGELTQRSQKRYDDTVLLLDAPVEHGLDSPEGRQGQRRINQMHRHYAIPNDQFRYVLATFVVIPKRWLDAYGWRPYSPAEVRAAVNYYRALGQRMNIKDIPATFEEFEELLDSYERVHFAFDAGGRAVSDATLDLVASWFRPFGALMRRATVCLMDDHLRETFRYPAPPAMFRRLVLSGMRARGRMVRLLPPRRKPFHGRRSRRVRGYPGYPTGYHLRDLGTFPTTFPPDAPTTAPTEADAHTHTHTRTQ